MQVLAQIWFIMALSGVAYFISQRIQWIKKAIQLGKTENRTDQSQKRIKQMLLVAFGQKKMFNQPLVAILHLLVYVGFVVINIEIIEIILDGILGTHRLFYSTLGHQGYRFLLNTFELLAVGVVVACAVFLIRRNLYKVARLQAKRHREMRGFPELDANIILVAEIALMIAFFKLNASDAELQTRLLSHYAHTPTGAFVISQFFQPLYSFIPTSLLIIIERATWWFHILGIFAFAIYVTYSKHLHIVLAFPNTFAGSLEPKGLVKSMPEVSHEVKLILGLPTETEEVSPITRFGAKDVNDLSWKNLMDAYTCTECGRCTSGCPANITGKALSPRKIMTDTRDRVEEVMAYKNENGVDADDGKSLLGDYITDEEILACTTCNACVEECPVMISPLDIIFQLRRYRVMEESKAPAAWNVMFQNEETNFSPWKFASNSRLDWINE